MLLNAIIMVTFASGAGRVAHVNKCCRRNLKRMNKLVGKQTNKWTRHSGRRGRFLQRLPCLDAAVETRTRPSVHCAHAPIHRHPSLRLPLPLPLLPMMVHPAGRGPGRARRPCPDFVHWRHFLCLSCLSLSG